MGQVVFRKGKCADQDHMTIMKQHRELSLRQPDFKAHFLNSDTTAIYDQVSDATSPALDVLTVRSYLLSGV